MYEYTGSVGGAAAALERACFADPSRWATIWAPALMRRPRESRLGGILAPPLPRRRAARAAAWRAGAAGRGLLGLGALWVHARGHPWSPDQMGDMARRPGRVAHLVRGAAGAAAGPQPAEYELVQSRVYAVRRSDF
jgi:hypothetical protein